MAPTARNTIGAETDSDSMVTTSHSKAVKPQLACIRALSECSSTKPRHPLYMSLQHGFRGDLHVGKGAKIVDMSLSRF